MSRTVSLCPWCHVHRGRGFKERKGAAGHCIGWPRENVSLEDVGVVRRYLLQIIWGSKKGEHCWQISGRLQLTNDLRTSSHLHWIPALAECKWKDKDKWKLDQGALGMSDPCGTLPSALKPNAVPRINCLLSNFYFCAIDLLSLVTW